MFHRRMWWRCTRIGLCLTDYIENATPPKSTKYKNSNFSVQIQIEPKSQFEFEPQDTEKSKFLDLADCGNAVHEFVCICADVWCVSVICDMGCVVGASKHRSFFTAVRCGAAWKTRIRLRMGCYVLVYLLCGIKWHMRAGVSVSFTGIFCKTDL